MSRPTQTVKIYTDGSAHEGYGGAAAILVSSRGRVKEISKSFGPFYRTGDVERNVHITNQTMELMAVIIGLKALRQPEPGAAFLRQVDVISDSKYVVNAFHEGWLAKWRSNGWRNYRGGHVANRAIWETLDLLVANFDVTFKHVKGHSGHKMNERADQLASRARLEATRSR